MDANTTSNSHNSKVNKSSTKGYYTTSGVANSILLSLWYFLYLLEKNIFALQTKKSHKKLGEKISLPCKNMVSLKLNFMVMTCILFLID